MAILNFRSPSKLVGYSSLNYQKCKKIYNAQKYFGILQDGSYLELLFRLKIGRFLSLIQPKLWNWFATKTRKFGRHVDRPRVYPTFPFKPFELPIGLIIVRNQFFLYYIYRKPTKNVLSTPSHYVTSSTTSTISI